ncbi:MAG: hypothetical protein ACI95C_000289 [Pseudohongiellaceae bacterium]|jgi:hypothetical protein
MSSRSVDIQCWHCGEQLKGILLPFSRFEECPMCASDLHTCKACHYYSPSLTSACNEDRADFVVEKTKANFCDFFSPSPDPFHSVDSANAAAAKAKLEALFSDSPEDQPQPATDSNNQRMSESDKALAELKRLFGDD